MPLQFASFLKLFASIWFVALLIFASSIDFALSPVQKPESEQMWMWIILGLRIDCSLITDLLSKGKAVEAQKDSSVMPSHQILFSIHVTFRPVIHFHDSCDFALTRRLTSMWFLMVIASEPFSHNYTWLRIPLC